MLSDLGVLAVRQRLRQAGGSLPNRWPQRSHQLWLKWGKRKPLTRPRKAERGRKDECYHNTYFGCSSPFGLSGRYWASCGS